MTLRVGDVFTVPLDEQRHGFGQVVATYKKHGHYFAIFDKAYTTSWEPVPGDIAVDRIALLALSFDAKIHVGDWKIVGNAPVVDNLPLPAYKVAIGTPDEVYVEDYSGQRQRRATRSEVDLLPYRTFVAPVRLENAFRALHGLAAWVAAFDGLVPNELTTTKRLFV